MLNQDYVNILLVDDRPEGLFTLESVLQSDNYRLVKAGSGEEALKCLLNEEFALVLLDVQMPGMDGFETATLIRERKRSRDVPIIFVTAINKEEVFVGKGYEAGAVDYIFKPFNPNILKSKVSVFVDLFRKNEQLKKQALLIQENERKIQAEKLIQLELENLRRYENLANAIPHMVWRANPEGKMEYFNRGWLDFTGLSMAQSVSDAWQSHIYEKDLSRFLFIWQSAIENKESFFELECRIRSAVTSDYMWFWIRAIAEYDSEGNVVSWLGTNTDIGARKEADKQKAVFLSIASHELKTPLTVMKSSMQAALHFHEKLKAREPVGVVDDQDGHPDIIGEFLSIGIESSDRIDELLDDFLDFSRVESGRLAIKLQPANLSEIVTKSVNGHMAKLKSAEHLSLISEIEDNIIGHWDPIRLRQVVDNLISNAIKYSPEEGTISVKLFRKDEEVIIAISDQGIGIVAADHKRIFKPFERVSGIDNISGLGIGLYISSWIIEEHKGKIELESEHGKGSVFKIRLPMKQISHKAISGEAV